MGLVYGLQTWGSCAIRVTAYHLLSKKNWVCVRERTVEEVDISAQCLEFEAYREGQPKPYCKLHIRRRYPNYCPTFYSPDLSSRNAQYFLTVSSG